MNAQEARIARHCAQTIHGFEHPELALARAQQEGWGTH